jgi:glucose 1-dehydrogenase
LVVASRNPDPEATEELAGLNGGHAVAVKVDVSDESAVVGMVHESIELLGGLDFYVNNAAWTWHEPVTEITSEAFHKTINTNLAACIWACREASRFMIPKRAGNILIVGSTVCAAPSFRETSYRISKMGLKMYAQTLAIELIPYGIRVNTLTPGGVKTKMVSNFTPEMETVITSAIPMRRFGVADEFGAAAVLLISDQLSSYTTGAEVVIDGGYSLRPVPWVTDEELLKLNTRFLEKQA